MILSCLQVFLDALEAVSSAQRSLIQAPPTSDSLRSAGTAESPVAGVSLPILTFQGAGDGGQLTIWILEWLRMQVSPWIATRPPSLTSQRAPCTAATAAPGRPGWGGLQH